MCESDQVHVMREFLVLVMPHVRQLWLKFFKCQVLCLVECRLKQKGMAVVIWRMLHQSMSLTIGI